MSSATSAMTSNVVLGDTGFLPDAFIQVELRPDDTTGWWISFTFLDGSEAGLGFVGGIDPRAWLTQELVDEHGFKVPDAVETARRLFTGFLPDEPHHCEASEPYGMEHPTDARAR